MNQKGFSTLWDGYATSDEAKKARDEEARRLRKEGFKVRRWVLRNQLRKYSGLGQPDGRSCNVFMIDILNG